MTTDRLEERKRMLKDVQSEQDSRNIPLKHVGISAYGAHNQRATASLEIESGEFVWIEELAEIADAGASAPVYGLLKRPDEKAVTEQAYDNPRFVEDAVREIALRLEADPRITWYRATVKSYESIHNHNAFACVEKGWK